jgi:CBS domain-containing protein
MEEALNSRAAPEVHKAVFCHPEQTVREIGKKFLESTTLVLIVIEKKTKQVRGIVTLHDLIRAQAAILD